MIFDMYMYIHNIRVFTNKIYHYLHANISVQSAKIQILASSFRE